MGAKRKSFGLSLSTRIMGKVDAELVEQNRMLVAQDEDEMNRSRFVEHLLAVGLVSEIKGREVHEAEARLNELGKDFRARVRAYWSSMSDGAHSPSDGVIRQVVQAHRDGELATVRIRPIAGVFRDDRGHYLVSKADVINPDSIRRDEPITLDLGDEEPHLVFVFDDSGHTYRLAMFNVALSNNHEEYI